MSVCFSKHIRNNFSSADSERVTAYWNYSLSARDDVFLLQAVCPGVFGHYRDRVKTLPRLCQLLGARERQCYLDKLLDIVAKICKNVHPQSPIFQCAWFPYGFSLGTPADVTKIQQWITLCCNSLFWRVSNLSCQFLELNEWYHIEELLKSLSLTSGRAGSATKSWVPIILPLLLCLCPITTSTSCFFLGEQNNLIYLFNKRIEWDCSHAKCTAKKLHHNHDLLPIGQGWEKYASGKATHISGKIIHCKLIQAYCRNISVGDCSA